MSSVATTLLQELPTALLLTMSSQESDVRTNPLSTPELSTVLKPVEALPTTPLLTAVLLESTFPAKNCRVSFTSGRKESNMHVRRMVTLTDVRCFQHAKRRKDANAIIHTMEKSQRSDNKSNNNNNMLNDEKMQR